MLLILKSQLRNSLKTSTKLEEGFPAKFLEFLEGDLGKHSLKLQKELLGKFPEQLQDTVPEITSGRGPLQSPDELLEESPEQVSIA